MDTYPSETSVDFQWNTRRYIYNITPIILLIINVKSSLRFPPTSQEALHLLVTEERYWALFYMPLYTLLHNLLNVLVQIENNMGLEIYLGK
jgi:hypothetical protein